MANGGKECRLCRYAGGTCAPGFRKVHVRTDPACRLHEVTEATGRFWETPGEYLSDEMAESYAAYRGRLRKRDALGKATSW